ncbi:hypothetical protein BV25DRAFT_146653 [Artomyces pyxidatus]|uniref:Uncharacterized protein n=1 Tax=Artomyces pyxidatus TaxID=48021 RepID=A0ACB8TB15_9AGAM|nr:hypothetical protein BV25DRAFT_146653 [Artomyces pyxidatus]
MSEELAIDRVVCCAYARLFFRAEVLGRIPTPYSFAVSSPLSTTTTAPSTARTLSFHLLIPTLRDMPRANAVVPSALRNRNRVTNKTRLRIIKGDIDADLAFTEDDEKARVVSTAGVDAEDANEHHLQAVLSAAAQRHFNPHQRATRGASSSTQKPQDAYIPTPDNTGVTEDYERWYSPDRWKDPVSYFKTSDTVEEALDGNLAHGFTYLMDEHDKEWLDKNNEEARGEGTSAQGALSTSGSTARLSQRSAKAKGKESDMTHPVAISEDEFELVMDLFEKLTHENAEFLHRGIGQKAIVPPFAAFEESFGSTLEPDAFAAFSAPSWIPSPFAMVRYAKAIYPHWRDRKIERNGQRIVPVLNYNESDTKNESYICFRRREVKNIRKTRASQASSSDKLIRLQQELLTTYELAKGILVREQLKREAIAQTRAVWGKRDEMIALKRKYPTLGAKEDEELLFDKERVVKKSKPDITPTARIGLRFSRGRENGQMASPAVEPVIRPKERVEMIQAQIDRDSLRMKERDHYWEDSLDHQPVALAPRHFQYIPWADNSPYASPPSSNDTIRDPSSPNWRAVRTRRGRGGVLRVDRRSRTSQRSEDIVFTRRSSEGDDDSSDLQEVSRRMRERWRFDEDDQPLTGPHGSDEQDRVLVDEFDVKYLRWSMSAFREGDLERLTTDATLYLPATPDGQRRGFVPYRLGVNPQLRAEVYAAAVATSRALAGQAADLQQRAQQVQASLDTPSSQPDGGSSSKQAQVPMRGVPLSLVIPPTHMASPALTNSTPDAKPIASQSSSTPRTESISAVHHAMDVDRVKRESPQSPSSIPSLSMSSSSGSSSATLATALLPLAMNIPNVDHVLNLTPPKSYLIDSTTPSQTKASVDHTLDDIKPMFNGPVNEQTPASIALTDTSNPNTFVDRAVPLEIDVGSNVAVNVGNANNSRNLATRQWAAQHNDMRRHPYLLSPQHGRASPATIGHGVTIGHSPHHPSPVANSAQQIMVAQASTASPSVHQQ